MLSEVLSWLLYFIMIDLILYYSLFEHLQRWLLTFFVTTNGWLYFLFDYLLAVRSSYLFIYYCCFKFLHWHYCCKKFYHFYLVWESIKISTSIEFEDLSKLLSLSIRISQTFTFTEFENHSNPNSIQGDEYDLIEFLYKRLIRLRFSSLRFAAAVSTSLDWHQQEKFYLFFVYKSFI